MSGEYGVSVWFLIFVVKVFVYVYVYVGMEEDLELIGIVLDLLMK